MRGKLKDLTFGMDGSQNITVTVKEDFRAQFDQLKDGEISVEIKKYRKRRSLDANAMMWAICSKVADVTGATKEDVYRRNIREVGQYTPLPIKAEAVDDFAAIWAGHGIGWFIDIVDDSKLDGYKLIFAYHGSSCYDTKQMSQLIDCVVQDAKAVGVEVISERERSLMLDAWASS